MLYIWCIWCKEHENRCKICGGNRVVQIDDRPFYVKDHQYQLEATKKHIVELRRDDGAVILTIDETDSYMRHHGT